MLFHRDFRGYTGGHGKVWDYFNHALALGWDAQVFLTPGSISEGNPWLSMPQRIVPDWRPGPDDVLFLAGTDWLAFDARLARDPDAKRLFPVVNLIQHVRHAVDDPDVPLRRFLTRRAWRICVSTAVAEAIAATGSINGPIRVIPAALNLPPIDAPATRGADVFVGALKQPDFGIALGERLSAAGYRADVCTVLLPRTAYVTRLAQARVCVMLPHPTEGFYLPGLEAMAIGCPLVMPDCIGSREYARPEANCLVPARDLDAIVEAVARLDDPLVVSGLVAQGSTTAEHYRLERERDAFASVLCEMQVA